MLNLSWPYHRFVAHRGSGISAPENTLDAFQHGFDMGYRMFECDAKVTADGIVYLLHDATLDRTTNSQGMAHHHVWDELSHLDAGSWHSEWFAGSGIPSLEQVAKFCIERNCLLNIEIKPSPGFESLTGMRVAQTAMEYWKGQSILPLLTSFKRDALQSALMTAPELPRGLLMHELLTDWQDAIQTLQCKAIACHYPIYTQALIQEFHQLELRCMAYTVNDSEQAIELLEMGVDTIITDNMNFVSELSTLA
jgi:glycerophosphoryl diester phosphodiesterase